MENVYPTEWREIMIDWYKKKKGGRAWFHRRNRTESYYDPYRVEMGSWNHLSTENIPHLGGHYTYQRFQFWLVVSRSDLMRGPITTRPIPNTLLLSASVSVLGELKLSENNTYNPSTSFSSYYVTKEEFPRFETFEKLQFSTRSRIKKSREE